MNLEKEMIRRLKLELEDAKSALVDMETTLNRLEHQNKDNATERRMKEYHQTLIATALKYGTMVAPNTMELTVSSTIGATGNYDVMLTYHPESNENTVRVRRG